MPVLLINFSDDHDDPNNIQYSSGEYGTSQLLVENCHLTLQDVYQVYKLLMRIVKQHPPYKHVPFKWEDVERVVDNIRLQTGIYQVNGLLYFHVHVV